MKKSYVGLIVLILILIFFFRLNTRVFRNSVEVGDYITAYGRVDAGIAKILKIDGKYPKNNLYMSVNKVEDGYAKIGGEIDKITLKRWGKIYSINVVEEEREENFLKNYFRGKIDSITNRYSLELENFYRAVILGEGEVLQEDLKKKFKYTGTAHVLVISGLHIGIVISGILFILLKAKIEKKIRYALALVMITIYVLSVGFTPSIFRAYLMGAIFLLGNIFYEKSSSKKSLLISFVVSLLIFPEWIYSLSFWMSYIAVFSIVVIYPKIPRIKNLRNIYIEKIVNSLVFMLTIQICMTPIMFIYFKSLPLFSFMSNFLIVPVATTFILSAFLTLFLSNFYLDFLLSPITNYIYLILIGLVSWIAEIPYLTLEF